MPEKWLFSPLFESPENTAENAFTLRRASIDETGKTFKSGKDGRPPDPPNLSSPTFFHRGHIEWGLLVNGWGPSDLPLHYIG